MHVKQYIHFTWKVNNRAAPSMLACVKKYNLHFRQGKSDVCIVGYDLQDSGTLVVPGVEIKPRTTVD